MAMQNAEAPEVSLVLTQQELDERIEEAGFGDLKNFRAKHIEAMGFMSRTTVGRCCNEGRMLASRIGARGIWQIKKDHLLDSLLCALHQVPLPALTKSKPRF